MTTNSLYISPLPTMPPSAQQHKCRSSIRSSHSSNINAMVVPAAAAPECGRREAAAAAAAAVFCRRGRGVVVPTVDMSAPAGRGELSRQVARACAGSGFFRAVNHGVPPRVSAAMDAAAAAFFVRAGAEKQLAGPPDPLGYGSRSIGANGDVGELEYLILHASPDAVARKASAIDREDPRRFSQVVNDYVEAVRQLACHVLDLLGEGLGLRDPTSLTRLITATDNDSLIRINHYPPSCAAAAGDHKSGGGPAPTAAIGFGEHTDPQILSVLRANDADGLQLLLPDAAAAGDSVWVPVPPDPSAFFVNVGDLLQALTNGRLVSIRHRVVVGTGKPRLSTIYFAAPPLHARISALPETVAAGAPRRYRAFTWAEYKRTMYTLRLSHNRLDLFHAGDGDGDAGVGDDDDHE
ncbi:gibberellin 2-beta-dioxygenase 2-like [Oryza sativa Japonica Group]|nr:gibberellin 2-beta-dioxygenase 2-like [Oryza sativa Japonica Group]